jgi:hypothetical protein
LVSAAVLFTVLLAAPPALASPVVARPRQAAELTGAAQVPCFGFNNMNDSSIPRTISSLRVALIQPLLTATPYSQYDTGSFYAFYEKEEGVTTNVTTSLDLLSTNVSSGSGFRQGWGLSRGMYVFFTSLTAVSCGLQIGKNVQILTDMQVADGALFDPQNNASRFDVVVLPFSEYVEASEYLAYEDFVAGGGTLIMMAHSLEYPVTYNATTNVETFVYGHGWAFNGKYAYRISCGSTSDASCPWAENSTDWIGSNSCLASCSRAVKYLIAGSAVNVSNPIGRPLSGEFGGTVFKQYVSHEEDAVTNMSGTSIVSVFVNGSANLIASYTHHFRKGTVVNFGFFDDDIIQTDLSARYFLLLGILYGRHAPMPTLMSPAAPSTSSTSSTSSTTALSSQTSSTVALATSATTTQVSSTTVLASSATALPSTTPPSSTLERTPASAVAASGSARALPSVLFALGGAAVVVVAGAVVLRRKQPSPGG